MRADALLPYRIPPSETGQAASFRFIEGQVKRVVPAGMIFAVPDWDGGKHEFGPAPWPMSRVQPTSGHDHAETLPASGDRALILFLGEGVDRPWVVSWWPS